MEILEAPTFAVTRLRHVDIITLVSALRADPSDVQVGSVFIARGIGAVLGAIVSSKLYIWMRGNTVMTAVLLFLTFILVYMPFVVSVYVLHGTFFLMGLCTAIIDTGCQIMTRKLHGSHAGPWLGANTVAFGISGALVPLIGYLTGSLYVQYDILSAFACMTAVFLVVLPAPEKYEGLLEVRLSNRVRLCGARSEHLCEHLRLSWYISQYASWT